VDPFTLHHVAVNVTDLERSKRFYREVLGLEEIARPPFSFPGAWFQVGGPGHHVHLIVHEAATTRGRKGIDTRDIHFALRVRSYREALESLRAKGYREDAAADDLLRMIVSPRATAGFPQIYVMDPDRNVIEINAESLD
jgi:glyoxylase I family protein